MKVTYIYHSGFLVELQDCYLLFDYHKGELPKLNTKKPVVVFASHFHFDHYNKRVFKTLGELGVQYQGVLASDIVKTNYPECKVTRAEPSKTYTLDFGLELTTLDSTDSGVAFLLKTPEGTLYHAGDLNDWRWAGEPEAGNKAMCTKYRQQVSSITVPVDIAFVPLDPRQEQYTEEGLLYFLQTVDCKAVYPMHYWEHPEVIGTFVANHPEYKGVIKNTEIAKETAYEF